jgi:hypothetical protein
MLLEPQSTNLITQSEAFDNAYWTKSGSSVTSGFISPTGGLDAFKLVSGSGGGNIIARPSLVSNTANTNSIYLKRVSGNGNVSLFNTAGNELVVTLTTEWKRFSVANSTNPSNGYAGVRLYGSGDEVLLFGAQTEQLTYPTSYIKTEGSTVTRLADTCSQTVPDGVINSVEGTLFFELETFIDGGDYMTFGLSDGTASNYMTFKFRINASEIWLDRSLGGVVVGVIKTSFPTNISRKLAVTWKSNELKWYIDAVEVYSTSVFTTFPANTLNSVKFQRNGYSTEYLYGNLKNLQVYKSVLTATEIANL